MRIVAPTRDLGAGSRRQKLLEYFPQDDVIKIGVELTPSQKARNLLKTMSPSRSRWREQSKKNAYCFRALSHNVAQSIDEHTGGQFDVILFFEALYGPGLGTAMRCPYVVYEDATSLSALKHWPEWVPDTQRKEEYRYLEREFYHGAERILTSNGLARQSLIEDYNIAPEKVVRIGQGNDWVKSKPEFRTESGSQILFVGYEFERKGGRILLEAFAKVLEHVPSAQLIIAGALVKDGGRNVTSLGPVLDKAELKKLYNQATVFVLPSLFDPMPHAAFEAMAMGVPTIVSDGCGTREMVTDGKDAMVIRAGDAKMLADRLVGLLKDGDLRRRIGTAGAETMREQLTWEQVAAKCRLIFEEISAKFQKQSA